MNNVALNAHASTLQSYLELVKAESGGVVQ